MTDKKILSPAEVLRALADEKKLTREGWEGWIHIQGDLIKDEIGQSSPLMTLYGFYEYIEPKPKVVWYEYVCTPGSKCSSLSGNLVYFKDNDAVPSSDEVWGYTPTGRKIEV